MCDKTRFENIFNSKCLSEELKGKVYKALVLPTLRYGYEAWSLWEDLFERLRSFRTRTRTNTNPNDTEANAAGRSGNVRALRKQSKCGVILRGRGIGQNSRKNCKKRGICG